MANFLQNLLNKIYKRFGADSSKMLIYTGAAAWVLSSIAQITGIALSKDIKAKDKSYIIPQEIMDAFVNIGAFLTVTHSFKFIAKTLISTGKIMPKSVKEFFNKNKDIDLSRIGKLDFDIENFKNYTDFPLDKYESTLNMATTIGALSGGILSSNIIAPVLRNEAASLVQKKYLNKNAIEDNQTEIKEIKKPATEIIKPQVNSNAFRSYGMKI